MSKLMNQIPNDNDGLSDANVTDKCHAFLRKCRGVQPRKVPPFETWFQRQSARLARLEAAHSRQLTDEEREFLEQYFGVGPSVLVCEVPVPPEQRWIAFAMDTPVANILVRHSIEAVDIMASRMGMVISEGRDPIALVESIGTPGAPLVLFCAIVRGRRKAILA